MIITFAAKKDRSSLQSRWSSVEAALNRPQLTNPSPPGYNLARRLAKSLTAQAASIYGLRVLLNRRQKFLAQGNFEP